MHLLNKTRRSAPGSSLKSFRRESGFALILVLGLVVVVTVLLVTFLLKVKSGTSNTAAYTQQASAEQLSALATQIVEAQIRAATTGGRNIAWASQPGMIRTWNNSGAPGSNYGTNYRLYSWNSLTTTTGSTTAFTGDDVSTWQGSNPSTSYNAMWCDLNSPISVPNVSGTTTTTVLNYPIVTPPVKDGNEATLDATNGVAINDMNAGTVDWSNTTDKGIQGFSVGPNPALNVTGTIPGFTYSTTASPTNNPAPMPVQWLYVLQDGSVVAPTAGTSTTGTVTIAGASQSNPIVGRIAYWTDDETCKVNLNTASEGNFWDISRAATANEAWLGKNQPAQNEFQRYPGHPAMTCLSPIFPNFSATTANVYTLVPRSSYGGSYAGTVQPLPAVAGGTPLTPGTSRLYDSVDEFFYQPSLTGTARTSATTLIDSGTSTDAAVTKEINQKRFFLTVSSQAPETNLFNLPRISIWPITEDSLTSAVHTAGTRMDAFDQLLAYCGSLWKSSSNVPYDYFFCRANALDMSFDYASIPRNQQLYAYLETLTGTATNVPGYGSNFVTKYGQANVDELLTQAFDYVRSGPDLMRVSDMNTTNGESTLPGYTIPAGGSVNNIFNQFVLPIQITTPAGTATKGMGNTYYIVGAGIGFYAENVQAINSTGTIITTSPMSVVAGNATNPVKIRYTVRPQLMVQIWNPTGGWAHPPSVINGSHSGTSPSATAAVSSLRYQATLTSTSGAALISVSTTGTTTPAGILVSGGTLDFPWGHPCELVLVPNSANLWESYGSQMFPSPTAFMIQGVGSSNTPSTGAGSIPSSLSSATAQSYAFRNSSLPTTATFNAVTYRTATPIVMDFPVPAAMVGMANNPSNNKRLMIERIQGLLTKNPGTTATSGGVANGFCEAIPTTDTAWGSGPRMSLSRFTMQIQLGFPDQTDPMPSTAVYQTLQLTFPAIPSLPVPSETYTAPEHSTAAHAANSGIAVYSPQGYQPNYTLLGQSSGGGYSNATLWQGYPNHAWFTQNATGAISLTNTTTLTYTGTAFFGNRYMPYDQTNGTHEMGNYLNPSNDIQPGDVIREMEIDGGTAGGPQGDWRVAILQPGTTATPPSWFASPTPNGSLTPVTSTGSFTGNFTGDDMRVHDFPTEAQAMQTYYLESAHLINGWTYPSTFTEGNGWMPFAFRQASSNMANGALMSNNGAPGDWNDEYGSYMGGANFSMPDVGAYGQGLPHWAYFSVPYIQSNGATDHIDDQNQYAATYSPNRQMFSPMQFGTLLTQASGVTGNAHPWQTLLFCPNSPAVVAASGALSAHPGSATNPPDHTFADLFWMPVVDPYPISEVLTTAGKINLNYQIEPFHYIVRATGMYALLKSMQITAISKSLLSLSSPSGTAQAYKPYGPPSSGTAATSLMNVYNPSAYSTATMRYPVAINETLKGFQNRFSTGNFFPSASAISEMFLYPTAALTQPSATATSPTAPPASIPTGPSLVTWVAGDTNMTGTSGWWNTNGAMTGDNTLEQPYAALYPRMTTKSNTYTIHVRAQMIKQMPNTTNWAQFRDGIDVVVSEYRGSETIERYLDPNDPDALDFATATTDPITGKAPIVDTHYYYRTLQRSRFTH